MLQQTTYKEKDYQKIKWSVMIISSILMASFHAIFINLAKVNGEITFSSASVALLIELLKLCISVLMLLKDAFLNKHSISINRKVMLLYIIPAFLYTANNNLVTHVQRFMDPGSFQILSNMKIATSVIFYRLIINRYVSRNKWLAVFFLFVASVLNSLGGLNIKNDLSLKTVYVTKTGICLICLYSCISGFTGVFTEAVLKTYIETSINAQNSILYLYGILLNILLYTSSSQSFQDFFRGFSLWTWLIVLTQAVNGIIISYVLKHSSTIVRMFIISFATVLTPLFSHFIFDLTLNSYFISSIVVVIFALYLHFNF
ncbi:probable UDP-sugar transporter protein SLC35A4 isoform X1 [Hydra vulgaris]|uniref:probable UDP-sugar transporter protein SLC35A4 isoform X1 n=1 Tax=Hydra vulgaris TaxID=6087 RepID=UPI001F5E8D92|nr:probable UDP-sugar transporter protein SLC35A4 isoform X1 [Hydra vulgaris]